MKTIELCGEKRKSKKKKSEEKKNSKYKDLKTNRTAKGSYKNVWHPEQKEVKKPEHHKKGDKHSKTRFSEHFLFKKREGKKEREKKGGKKINSKIKVLILIQD